MRTLLLFISLSVAPMAIAHTKNQTETLPPSPEKAARASAPPAPNATGLYGEAISDKSAPAVSSVLPTVEQLKKQKSSEPAVVKAKVLGVCPKKGCWMQVEGPQGPLRVTFQDYSFFVPVELVGKEVLLKGRFVVHKESVAEQKHLLEDARRPKEEIEAIKTEKESLRFVATGVKDPAP